MAGGSASRMGYVEKPLVPLNGRPMISYVLKALLESEKIDRIYIVLSPKVPETSRHICEVYHGHDRIIPLVTSGTGYVEDTVEAVKMLKLFRPFLIVSSDIPLITPSAIDHIVTEYEKCGKESLSVRVDAAKAIDYGIRSDIILKDTGTDTIPSGINIIDGSHMYRAQDEHVLVVDDPALAVNVNYTKDLDFCSRLIDVR